jgi:hypothetical protein
MANQAFGNAAVAALVALFLVAIAIVPKAHADLRGGHCKSCYDICQRNMGRPKGNFMDKSFDVLACQNQCNREACVRANNRTGCPGRLHQTAQGCRPTGSRLPPGEIPY